MVGRARWVVILAIVASSCEGGSSPPSEAAAFQLRPVVQIVGVSSPSPGSDAPDPTCEGEGQRASACLGRHANESVVVLEPTRMDTYELGPVVVDGADVAEARALHNAAVGWSVVVDLTPEGTDELAAVTRRAVGDQIAILVDGRLVSAPTVQAPIGAGVVVVASGLSET